MVPDEVLDLLKAKDNFPNREYVLASSEMRTLMDLPRAVGGLVESVRKAIVDLEETKKSVKYSAIAHVRYALKAALFSLDYAQRR